MRFQEAENNGENWGFGIVQFHGVITSVRGAGLGALFPAPMVGRTNDALLQSRSRYGVALYKHSKRR
jgi:hypothetical protein